MRRSVEQAAGQIQIADAKQTGGDSGKALTEFNRIAVRKRVEKFLQRLGLQQRGVGDRIQIVQKRRLQP